MEVVAMPIRTCMLAQENIELANLDARATRTAAVHEIDLERTGVALGNLCDFKEHGDACARRACHASHNSRKKPACLNAVVNMLKSCGESRHLHV